MSEPDLRCAVEAICDQLCQVAAGNLDVRLDVLSDDLSAQKLAMLANAVLHVARRAVAAAETSQRDLARAHETARLGTWWVDLTAGVQSWHWSPELCRVLGCEPSPLPPGQAEYFALVHPADRARVAASHERALAGFAEGYEWRACCPDGQERRIWTELQPELAEGAVRGLRAVCQDVSERHAAETRIRHLAEHDGLTNLANRNLLRSRLDKVLTPRQRQRGGPVSVAVLCVDLDGFKAVNDHHGHAAGDAVLMQVAQRMTSLARGSDTIARLGGDEFAIIQPTADQPAAAERLAASLLAALSQPYDLGHGVQVTTISASIGVAFSPGDATKVDALLAAADIALYRAKASGRNCAAFYHPEMEREARERRAIEADLAQAVVRGEMSIAYQPLVDVGTGQPLGFEALLRWSHPLRGAVPPDLFIPIAEGNGTILPIGDWVLEQACGAAAGWPQPLFIAVNVSPLQLQRGTAFADMVEGVLSRTGLAPCRLELEVTEGVLIRDAEAALDALRQVRALGVRVALDDFGTGYSSLATLQAFPFDKIKVDRRFIAGLGGGSDQDAAIVRAVLGLARGLGVPVVAEGVETAAQLEALRAENCAEAQGWLFGRPAAVPGGFRIPAAACAEPSRDLTAA